VLSREPPQCRLATPSFQRGYQGLFWTLPQQGAHRLSLLLGVPIQEMVLLLGQGHLGFLRGCLWHGLPPHVLHPSRVLHHRVFICGVTCSLAKLSAYSERLSSLNPEATQRTKSRPNLSQSMQSQNIPPVTRTGDEPYSSAYTPMFQNSFMEITREIELKTRIAVLSALFSRLTSFPVFTK